VLPPATSAKTDHPNVAHDWTTKEEHMKSVLIPTTFIVLAAGLQAQAPAGSTVKPASGDTQSMSDHERNTQAYIQLLRSDIKKTKSQVMGEVMNLDAQDSAKFWPVYKEFEAELTKLGDQVTDAVRTYADNYDKMTDPMADKLANKTLSIEQQRNALKKKYYDRVKSSMGAIMAMRFLQIENQLERILDLQLAAQLPVAAVAR
jgi:hypothetical protein